MGMLRARHDLVKTETGLEKGFAKVLGAAIFRFRYIPNGSEQDRSFWKLAAPAVIDVTLRLGIGRLAMRIRRRTVPGGQFLLLTPGYSNMC